MSKAYHKRIITFDANTDMFIVSVPDLNIIVMSDTETSAVVEARRRVEEYYLETAMDIKKLSNYTIGCID